MGKPITHNEIVPIQRFYELNKQIITHLSLTVTNRLIPTFYMNLYPHIQTHLFSELSRFMPTFSILTKPTEFDPLSKLSKPTNSDPPYE